jgi:uncharacterized membrane protein
MFIHNERSTWELRRLGFAVMSGVLAGGALGQPPFRGIGDFPDGPTISGVEALSNDGSTLAGEAAFNEPIGIRWYCSSPSGFDFFEVPPFRRIVRLAALSADGSLAVGRVDPYELGSDAFRARCGEAVEIVHLPDGCAACDAVGISDDGTAIAIGITVPSATHAYRWSAEEVLVISPVLGRDYIRPFGISGDGRVIAGGGPDLNPNPGFRWSVETGTLPLGDLAGGMFLTMATGASYDGSVIVGGGSSEENVIPGTTEAFRWTEAQGLVGLDDLPGGLYASKAADVSSDGSVIVGQASTDRGREAFIWDEQHGLRNLREVLENE